MLDRFVGTVAVASLLLLGVTSPAVAAPVYGYGAHVQDVGWQSSVSDGVNAGTVGKAKRLEAIRFDASSQQARAHVQDVGWQEWRDGASTVGTTGLSKRLEAVQVKSSVAGVRVECQAHVQDIGWMPVVGDGEICGTVGQSKRLEAVRLWAVGSTPAPVTPPTTPAPTPTPTPPATDVLSTVATAGDFNAGAQSAEVLRQMGASNPDLALILGDISQSATSSKPTCDLINKHLADDPFGWVQGNHDTPPDSDGPLTADWNKCLPTTPNATGTRGVEEVIRIPGARIITASPHLPGSNYDAGSAGLARIASAIDAAKAAGDFPILAIHRPHYTVGLHGTSGTQSKALSQLAIDKGVKLVLNGHDHNYARLHKDGTTFVTVGTGGHGPRALNAGSPYTYLIQKAYAGTPGAYGWLQLSITKASITGKFIGTHGPDSFTLTK